MPTFANPSTSRAVPVVFAPWLMLAGVLTAALTLRCLGIDKSIWIDEASSYAQATATPFLAAARNYDHPPLYFLLLRLGTFVTGSFALLRVGSVVCGLVTIVLSASLRPALAGGLAAVFMALHPQFVASDQELRQYALLTVFLAGVLRLAFEADSAWHGRKPLLVVLSVSAVCTHLIAAFFIAAIALVSAVRHRREAWPAQALHLALFAPAALAAWLLKDWFLTQTAKNPAEWWPGPASLGGFGSAFSIASGWSSLTWTADAIARHLPHTRTLLHAAAALAAGGVLGAAWRWRTSTSQALVATALTYWTLLTAYSFTAANLLLVRLILPGMLPLLWAVALGIAAGPRRWRAATAAMAMTLAAAAAVPWVGHFAWEPVEDIRGLTATLRDERGPQDQIVVLSHAAVVSAPEYAIGLYWPEFAATGAFVAQAGEAAPAAILQLVDRLPPGRGVLLVYRNDPNLRRHPERVRTVQEILARRLSPAHILWDKDQYFIERYSPRSANAVRG